MFSLYPLIYFLCKILVRASTLTPFIVFGYRLTMTWCFGQPHITWDHRLEQLVTKMPYYFTMDLVGQCRTLVKHGHHHTQKFQLWIIACSDLLHNLEKLA